jgi:hypothetical protein
MTTPPAAAAGLPGGGARTGAARPDRRHVARAGGRPAALALGCGAGRGGAAPAAGERAGVWSFARTGAHACTCTRALLRTYTVHTPSCSARHRGWLMAGPLWQWVRPMNMPPQTPTADSLLQTAAAGPPHRPRSPGSPPPLPAYAWGVGSVPPLGGGVAPSFDAVCRQPACQTQPAGQCRRQCRPAFSIVYLTTTT